MKRKMKFFGGVLLVVLAAAGFYLWGLHGGQSGAGIEIVKSAEAAGGAVKSPTGTAPNRYLYFPGTEELGKNEILWNCVNRSNCRSKLLSSRTV